jgi:hypothetical protein
VRLWWATLGGLAVWAAHLVLSYAVVAAVCGEERRLALAPEPLLIALSVAALAAAAHATWLAQRMWRRGRGAISRLAFGGLLLSGLAVVAIAAAGVIPAFLRPCG